MPYINSKEKEVLISMYPTVIKFIDDLNGYFKLSSNRNKTSEDKAPFAYLTQRIEARFVLDICCKRISEEYLHVPIFTIHDSILTTPEYEELVQSVMVEEGKKYFSLGVANDVRLFK